LNKWSEIKKAQGRYFATENAKLPVLRSRKTREILEIKMVAGNPGSANEANPGIPKPT
jgi:hypothetical protein